MTGALGVAHAVQVCYNTPQVHASFLLDVALAPEATGGKLVCLVLHPPAHYASNTALLGRVRLRERLLSHQGWAVVGVSALEWSEVRNVDEAVALLRKLLQPHIRAWQQ